MLSVWPPKPNLEHQIHRGAASSWIWDPTIIERSIWESSPVDLLGWPNNQPIAAHEWELFFLCFVSLPTWACASVSSSPSFSFLPRRNCDGQGTGLGRIDRWCWGRSHPRRGGGWRWGPSRLGRGSGRGWKRPDWSSRTAIAGRWWGWLPKGMLVASVIMVGVACDGCGLDAVGDGRERE